MAGLSPGLLDGRRRPARRRRASSGDRPGDGTGPCQRLSVSVPYFSHAEFERQFAAAVVENLSTSIANNVREAGDVASLVEGEERLTAEGRMYVRGYVTGRLTMLRAGVVGNPNLSGEDLEVVRELVEEHEGQIAAALYA